MSRICVISSNYPSASSPARGVFVKNLVYSWRELGAVVDVVAPQKLSKIRDYSEDQIIRPTYLSLGDRKLFGISSGALSDSLFAMAVTRNARNSTSSAPTVIYAHFLYPSGLAAARFRDQSFPLATLVVALGESDMGIYERRYGLKSIRQLASRIDLFVAVSEHLRDYATEELGVDPNRVLLAPNEANKRRFRALPKVECRRSLGWPQDKFIVIFVGHLNERKGAGRVCEALANMPGIHLVMVGAGDVGCVAENVQQMGVVPNERLPVLLAAADLFVLPTLGEGRCNAIEEALACELPVVMGDIPGARDQVVSRGGLLVPPLDIAAIRELVTTLQSNPVKLDELKSQTRYARVYGEGESREKKILDWITREDY